MPRGQGRAVLDAMVARRVVAPPDASARESLIEQAVAAALTRFDAASREYAYHRNQELRARIGRALADLDESLGIPPSRGWSDCGAGTSSSSTASCSTRPRRYSRDW